MTVMDEGVLAKVRREGRSMQVLFAVAFWGAAASLIGGLVVWPLVRVARSARAGEWSGLLSDIGLRAADAAPLLILAGGLWSAQRMFGRVGEGEIFTSANAVDVKDIGSAMIWAGVAAVLIAPSVKGWIRGDTTLDLDLQDWAIVVVLLGAAVALVGRIWGLAVALKADADQIV